MSRRTLSLVVAMFGVVATGLVLTADSGTRLRANGGLNVTPSMATAGTFVAVAWGVTRPGRGSDVVVAMSRDAGVTFGPPVRVNQIAGEAQLGSERPPRVALVPRGRIPEILVLWSARREASNSIMLARSGDGGRTFTPATTVQQPNAPGNRGWASMTVDATGTPHVLWLDHRAAAGAGTAHAGHVMAAATEGDGAEAAQRSSLFYASPGTGSGAAERELTRGVCYCCKTSIATGPDGLVAAAWRHVYPGNIRDIALALSHDGGRTFSAPARVSEDGWSINGCPEDGPDIEIDATGLVHIVWPTMVRETREQGALFYATTRDGRAFTRRNRVPTFGGPKPEHPQITVAADQVLVAWDELLHGRRMAGALTIVRARQGVTMGTPKRLGAGLSARTPMLARGAAGWLAVWVSGDAESAAVNVQSIAP